MTLPLQADTRDAKPNVHGDIFPPRTNVSFAGSQAHIRIYIGILRRVRQLDSDHRFFYFITVEVSPHPAVSELFKLAAVVEFPVKLGCHAVLCCFHFLSGDFFGNKNLW